jgi:hypothetical protein
MTGPRFNSGFSSQGEWLVPGEEKPALLRILMSRAALGWRGRPSYNESGENQTEDGRLQAFATLLQVNLAEKD